MKTQADNEYLGALRRVLETGDFRPTRGTLKDGSQPGSFALFGQQMHFDMRHGFPILLSKKVSFKNIVTELLWFLRGDTNVAYLHEHGCKIWDEWCRPNGDLGPVYGHQWRRWTGLAPLLPDNEREEVDQIDALVHGLAKDPFGRRHIVTAWNPVDIPEMALPPCHAFWQVCVGSDGGATLHLYQRSADIFLGVPYNIASYAALLHLIVNSVNCLSPALPLKPKALVISFGDLHLYGNHVEAARQQLSNQWYPAVSDPQLEIAADAPTIRRGEVKLLGHKHLLLSGYSPLAAIPAEVAK